MKRFSLLHLLGTNTPVRAYLPPDGELKEVICEKVKEGKKEEQKSDSALLSDFFYRHNLRKNNILSRPKKR